MRKHEYKQSCVLPDKKRGTDTATMKLLSTQDDGGTARLPRPAGVDLACDTCTPVDEIDDTAYARPMIDDGMEVIKTGQCVHEMSLYLRWKVTQVRCRGTTDGKWIRHGSHCVGRAGEKHAGARMSGTRIARRWSGGRQK